jgi:hypothetical protein
MPKGFDVELLMPSAAIVTERFLLPQAPREDLLAMAQLQLEKLLPYAAEDFVFDLEELGASEEGCEVLAVTVPLVELMSCAKPLRDAGRRPTVVGVYPVQLARQLKQRGVACAIWKECGRPFLLISKDGKLVWLEILETHEGALDAGEIARSLLSADLAGALPQPIAAVCLGEAEWLAAVREAFPEVAVESVVLSGAGPISGNWLPAVWAQEEAAIQRKSLLVNRIQWAVTAYAALLALCFGWLAFEKARLAKLDRLIAELQPQVEVANARQSKWRNLEAAIEPSRYLIEVLHQISKTVGAADIRITEFQMGPREFAFSGEAANVAEAIEYVGRLKKEPELSGFKVESPNPNILPNERAQFRVTGRVETSPSKK